MTNDELAGALRELADEMDPDVAVRRAVKSLLHALEQTEVFKWAREKMAEEKARKDGD